LFSAPQWMLEKFMHKMQIFIAPQWMMKMICKNAYVLSTAVDDENDM
jgi:hypothetical protein